MTARTIVDVALAATVRNVTAELRDRAAELEVLERFDAIRQAAGHDYGAGQRHAELVRRRRELDARDPLHTIEPPAADELWQAFVRVGLPRLVRLDHESYRSATPATRRTIESWRKLTRRLERGRDEVTS